MRTDSPTPWTRDPRALIERAMASLETNQPRLAGYYMARASAVLEGLR